MSRCLQKRKNRRDVDVDTARSILYPFSKRKGRKKKNVRGTEGDFIFAKQTKKNVETKLPLVFPFFWRRGENNKTLFTQRTRKGLFMLFSFC